MSYDPFKTENSSKLGRRFAVMLLVACASAAASNGWAHAEGPAEAQILAAELSRLEAQVARDAEAVAGGVADDAIYIHANGAIQTKTEFITDLSAGRILHRDVVLTSRTVAVHDDTGITHGTIALTVGVDCRIVGAYTGVYILRDGAWKVLSWQTTPIQARTDASPAPAPAPASASR